MSYYPPGVTGFEPQIAGYPEVEYSVPYCTGDDCDFDGGQVEGIIDNSMFYYACPNCDLESETAYDTSPDPDDLRDLAWEDANL